jgi:peptidoglycan-N-acetylglucosamine deacetylase
VPTAAGPAAGNRRLVVVLLIWVSLLAVLCGCSIPNQPLPTSSSDVSSSPQGRTGPARSSKRTAERSGFNLRISAGVGVGALPSLPARLLHQQAPYRLVDGNSHLDVAVPQVLGAPVLNRELRRVTDNFVRSFRRTIRRQAGMGSRGYHGMMIDWQLIGRSRQVIGIEVWVTQQHGPRVSTDRRTVWYDSSARRLLALPDLFRRGIWPQARQAITSSLADNARVATHDRTSWVDRRLLEAGGPAFGFSSTGDLVLTPAARAPAGAIPVSLRLDGRALRSLLSSAGLLVRASARPTAGQHHPTRADCSREKCLALTFDDGPAAYTPQLLALLQQRRAAATFFVLGSRVQQAPEILAELKAAGMEVGNHSTNHHSLTSLSDSQMRSDLRETNRAITAVIGRRPRLMRPPYGARSRRVDAVARQLGMPQILWNVDTLDWRYPDSRRLTNTVLTSARPGSIVLMHDAINRSTITAMPAIIDQLQHRGFRLVTVSQLLGATRPGHVYRRAAHVSR